MKNIQNIQIYMYLMSFFFSNVTSPSFIQIKKIARVTERTYECKNYMNA